MVRLLVSMILVSAGHGGLHGPTDLTIVVRDGTGDVKRATLQCIRGERRATGFLRGKRPRRLCERAEELRPLLRSPDEDPERLCTQEYGSAHTGRIRGDVAGETVDRRFHRRDGCGISDWREARRLLGGEPPGPEPISG